MDRSDQMPLRGAVSPPGRPDGIGIIRDIGPEGEADFEDNRYWVEALEVRNDDDDDLEAMLTDVIASGKRGQLYTMMTNISEPDDEHNLEVGTRVHFFWDMDRTTPRGQRKYWFTLSAAVAIVAAGHFNALGSARGESIAAWNGRSWEYYNSASGQDGPNNDIRHVIWFNDELYICGRQIGLPTTQVVSVAKWNGTDWVALGGSGTPADYGNLVVAMKMCIFQDKLIVVGDDGGSGACVAYDGSSWSSLAAGGPNFSVLDCCVYQDELHVVGQFWTPSIGWCKYDGTAWQSIGTGLQKAGPADGEGWCCMVNGDDLYIGGKFITVNGVADCINVVKIRGTTPKKLGTGMIGSGGVYAMKYHENDEGRRLYACGQSVIGNPLAYFTGTTWQPVGAQLYAAGGFTIGYGLTEYRGELIMAGAFDAQVEEQFTLGASRVVRSDLPGTDEMIDLGVGVNAAVRALAIYDGDVYAGGSFTKATQTSGEEITAHRLASFSHDTETWNTVANASAHVRALCPYNGFLVIGGDFTTMGGLPAARLARWDGAAITTFGGTNGPVHCLYDDSGTLIIGGGFTLHDGAPAVNANGILTWDGLATWGTFGDGFTYSDGDAIVRSVIRFGGDIYACGRFEYANAGGATTVNHIAKWTGATWAAMGAGLDGEAYCMIEYDGLLWVGGDFQTADGVSSPFLACWDGAAWIVPTVTLYRMVEAMLVFDGNLHVAGTTATGTVGRVFVWDTATWTELAESFDGHILAMTSGDAGAGDHPYIGGDFGHAGDATTDADAPANRVMRYNPSGLFNVGGGVGVTPNITLGISGGACYGCQEVAVAIGTDDERNLLFVYGSFGVASNTLAESIGRSGRRGFWQTYGRGLRGDFSAFIRQARCALRFDDDGGGVATFVCGAFSRAVSESAAAGVTAVDAACVAKYRNGAWSGGMDLDYLATAMCIHAFPVVVAAVLDDENRARASAGSFAPNLRGTRVSVSGGSGTNVGDYTVQSVESDEEIIIVGAWPGALSDSVSLTIYPPELYCVGWFSTVDRIGRWDVGTQTWQAVGDLRTALGADFVCTSCISFQDNFWVAILGGSSHVWMWDGSTWTSIAPGGTSGVNHLFLGDLGDGETLYCAATAASSGDQCVFKLDPGLLTWSSLGSNTGSMERLAIQPENEDEPRRLIAFGGGMDISATIHNCVSWDGAAWTALGSVGPLDLTSGLEVISSRRLWVAGLIDNVDAINVSSIALLDTGVWAPPKIGGGNGHVLFLARRR